jgi:hypothetical protein
MTAEELKAIRDRLRIYGLAACADEEMVSALLDEVERLRRLLYAAEEAAAAEYGCEPPPPFNEWNPA